jgi:hypothetical protein
MARDLPARSAVKNGPKTVENGRDARGRFLPGNAGGGRPANPFARYQAELRGALLAEVKPADLLPDAGGSGLRAGLLIGTMFPLGVVAAALAYSITARHRAHNACATNTP